MTVVNKRGTCSNARNMHVHTHSIHNYSRRQKGFSVQFVLRAPIKKKGGEWFMNSN